MQAFADNKMKWAEMTIFVFDRFKNIVGKGENSDSHYFLLLPQNFLNTFYSKSSRDYDV